MLSDEQVRDLAEQLYQAEFTRTPMTPISQTHPDADIADAYRIGAIVTELKVAAGRKVKDSAAFRDQLGEAQDPW